MFLLAGKIMSSVEKLCVELLFPEEDKLRLWTIDKINNIGRYNLIDTKYSRMAFWSVPTSHLFEPLVKQKLVVTARRKQPMKFVV